MKYLIMKCHSFVRRFLIVPLILLPLFSAPAVRYQQPRHGLSNTHIDRETNVRGNNIRQSGVLFVEDPGSTVFGPLTKPDPQWKGVLDQLFGSDNYGWYACTTAISENGPPLDTMIQYELVIWNTYDYWWPDTAALTEDDQNNIALYLTGGGQVWLIGQDIVWSGVPVSWLTDYFHVADVIQDYDTLADSIALGGLAELGGLGCVTTPDYQYNVFYPDELVPDAQAHSVVEDTVWVKAVGTLYSGTDWKSAYWSVDGRNTNPPAQWVSMVDNMLLAFGIDSHAEECGAEIVTRSISVLPNPMISFSTIHVSVAQPTVFSIRAYDACGRYVMTICDQLLSAGSHSFAWNGTDGYGAKLPGGVYYILAEFPDGCKTCPLVILR